jgi:CheY-like chemotaxis protein
LDAVTSLPEQKAMIAVVQKSLDRLKDLIDDTLDLSRIERKSMELEFAKFDPTEVLATRLMPFQKIAKQKGLSFAISIQPSFPLFVWGEPNCFGRIVAGLVSNAVKFTPTGSVIVKLEYVEDAQLSLIVQDTGIGITEADQPHVFDLFTQGDSSNTRIYEGIGLGLALVRNMVELLGGSLSLTSKLGYGSTFSAVFPFEALAYPFVSSVRKQQRRQILVLSALVLHNMDTLTLFTEFYGWEIVFDENVDMKRLIVIFCDNSDVQKSRALQISAFCSNPVFLIVLSDEEMTDVTHPSFIHIPSSSWVLRVSKLLRQPVVPRKVKQRQHSSAWSQQLHVLIIVGDSTDELVLRTIIDKIESTCVIASNSDMGLAQLRDGQFDVVIMNRHCSLADGRTLGEVVMKDPSVYCGIPLIVIVEAAWLQTDLEWCRQNRVQNALRKPFTVSNVFDALWAIRRV